MAEQTLEARVENLEKLVDKLTAYARSTALGRAILAKLGVDDA